MSQPKMTPAASRLWFTSMPAVLVVLWSTGFIGAKFGLPYAEPATFLAYRCSLVAAILTIVALAMGAPWPRTALAWFHMAVVGLLIQAVNLGGVFVAIHNGVDASVTALINGLQPLLVAIIAGPVLGERTSRLQWLGFVLGLGGVAMVVWRKLELGIGTPFAMSMSVAALLGLSIGVIYQKRFCAQMDLRTGTAIQTGAAAGAMWILAFAFESRVIHWTGEFIFAFVWLSFVLSLGAIILLLYLISQGQAARVSSLFFLVPGVTAIISYFMFGETFGPIALIGMIIAAIGVALVNRQA